MRRDLRFTLLPEGVSDRALMPILEWTLLQHFSTEDWTVVGSLVQSDRLPMGAKADRKNPHDSDQSKAHDSDGNGEFHQGERSCGNGSNCWMFSHGVSRGLQFVFTDQWRGLPCR